MLRFLIVGISIIVIVFTIERFIFSSERANLFAWWFFSGDSTSVKTPLSERVSADKLDAYKKEIQNMLQNAEQDSTTQAVALNFADEFVDDPNIKEQLIIIAFEHPTHLVRCELRKKLGLNHEIIVTSHSSENTHSARFSTGQKCE